MATQANTEFGAGGEKTNFRIRRGLYRFIVHIVYYLAALPDKIGWHEPSIYVPFDWDRALTECNRTFSIFMTL